eukprot:COSAG02_NODE_1295_length_13400_cov_5.691828_17_plen_87_part_00
MAAEGDQLVVAAMDAHPAHHKLQQLGCSILASLAANRDGSLPLPIVPRALADMPHRTHRQYVQTCACLSCDCFGCCCDNVMSCTFV